MYCITYEMIMESPKRLQLVSFFCFKLIDFKTKLIDRSVNKVLLIFIVWLSPHAVRFWPLHAQYIHTHFHGRFY